jgi:hypothetical protein
MAPILGIYASQISGHLFAPSGAYDSIATVTAGAGGIAGVTFSSIPQTYKHLQLRITQRSTSSNTSEFGIILINGVYYAPFTQYAFHALLGNGTNASAYGNGDQARIQLPTIANASLTANVFDTWIIDLLDYANTNKNKTVRTIGGWDANGSGLANLTSGVLKETNAITSFTFGNAYGNNAQYSSFALYGIKGS